MRQDLLDSVSRRDGLHIIWIPSQERASVAWLCSLGEQLLSLGDVVFVDLARVLPIDKPSAPCLLDGRIHQGIVNSHDDLTLPWGNGLHVLPTGIYEFPAKLDAPRLRNLLVNLQLLRERFSSTIILLPFEWKQPFTDLVLAASSLVVITNPQSHAEAFSTLRDIKKIRRAPLIFAGQALSRDEVKHLGKIPFATVCLDDVEFPDAAWLAQQMQEARRVHILTQNPPEGWTMLLHRFWWLAALALSALVFVIPLRLDSPESLFHDLDAEKKMYSGKPFIQYRFDGQEPIQRLAKHAIGRYTALVPAESEVHDYIMETLVKNNSDTASWKHENGVMLIPKDSTTLRFFPPEHIFNAKADSLMPAWSFFISIVSDSLAYVTEYYNEFGVGGRKHLGIDIAGKKGSRILAPFAGKAYTTLDERGGVVIALVNGKSVLLFMHCDQLLYLDGQDVFAGDPLATVGMTGHTTGPHVHFVTGLVEPNGAMTAGPVRFRTINPVQWFFQNKPHS